MTKGWNISPANRIEIWEFIKNMNPKNKEEERNQLILELAFVNDLSALAISKLNDDRIVSFSNRGKGKPLSSNSISRIINSYDLVKEKAHDYTQRNWYQRRKALTNARQKGEIKKPFECGWCGNKQGLELHHIIPIELGGNDDCCNLIYLCKDCHKRMHRNIFGSLTKSRNTKEGGKGE